MITDLFKNVPNHPLSKIGRYIVTGAMLLLLILFFVFINDGVKFQFCLLMYAAVGSIGSVIINIGDMRADQIKKNNTEALPLEAQTTVTQETVEAEAVNEPEMPKEEFIDPRIVVKKTDENEGELK